MALSSSLGIQAACTSIPRLNLNQSKTGLFFDKNHINHNLLGHPESADRLRLLQKNLNNSLYHQITPRAASFNELERAHSKKYLESLFHHQGNYLTNDKWSPYWSEKSLPVVLRAAGGTIDLAEKIYNQEIKNGFAITRPPGHHAGRNGSKAYCVINNIAVSALNLRQKLGVQKIAIIDIDAHHGDGTQDIFYRDPDTLVISIHQRDHFPFSGHEFEIGEGGAKGLTLNIPLTYNSGDQNYQKVMEELVLKKLDLFKPEFIFVAIGFDAHWRDFMAGMGLTLFGYDHLVTQLNRASQKHCGGKILYALEGGYVPQVVARGVINTLHRLRGVDDIEDPYPRPQIKEPDISKIIQDIKKHHQIS